MGRYCGAGTWATLQSLGHPHPAFAGLLVFLTVFAAETPEAESGTENSAHPGRSTPKELTLPPITMPPVPGCCTRLTLCAGTERGCRPEPHPASVPRGPEVHPIGGGPITWQASHPCFHRVNRPGRSATQVRSKPALPLTSPHPDPILLPMGPTIPTALSSPGHGAHRLRFSRHCHWLTSLHVLYFL